MVASKKGQNQITAAVFIFLGLFIYGISVGEMTDGENRVAIANTDAPARTPASVD